MFFDKTNDNEEHALSMQSASVVVVFLCVGSLLHIFLPVVSFHMKNKENMKKLLQNCIGCGIMKM